MAAVDVTGVVLGIGDYLAPIGLVGSGMLLLYSLEKAFQWLRAAMFGGVNTGAVGEYVPSADDQALYDRADAAIAALDADLAGKSDDEWRSELRALVDKGGEDGSWAFDKLYSMGLAQEGVDFDTLGSDAERAAADGFSPSDQFSSGPAFNYADGASYADDSDDMDPSALSDSQRRAMMG